MNLEPVGIRARAGVPRVLRRFGVLRRPSVCIWSFYEGNDLADIDEYAIQRERIEEALRTGQGLNPTLIERSFVANALGFALRTWIDPAPRRPASQHRGWFTDDRGNCVPLYFASGDYRRPAVNSAPSAAALDRFRGILRNAHSLCRDRGIRLVVVFIPTKLRVYSGACRF